MSSSNSVRRRTLLTGGASLFVSFAGCSSPFNSLSEPEPNEPPPLYEIVWQNNFDHPMGLTVLVKRDGDIVYWKTHEVPPANANPKEKDLGNAFGIAKKEWMGCGTYEVSARLSHQSKWATVDFRELEPARGNQIQPVEVEIYLSSNGISINPQKIDEDYSCKKNKIVTSETQKE